jgi:hypothetical protein
MSFLQNPAVKFLAIIPDDNNNLSDANGEVLTRAVYIGGNGNISFINHEGNSVVLTGCVAGTFFPIQVSRINSTGTTATNIVAFY